MQATIQFLLRHGYSVLFLWVLAEQTGAPLPAIPLLLAAGAVAASGRLQLGWAVLLALLACLLADLAWYELGRRRGGEVLNLLCRISLEPDSCVRRTENLFSRYGGRALLVAKFIPGLSTVAPPLAGIVGLTRRRFLLLDAGGALLWGGGLQLAGYLLHDQLEQAALYALRLGYWLLVLLLASLGAYLSGKYLQRRRFLRELDVARISPEELKRKLDAGEQVVIVDLRHSLDFAADPQLIPGAIRMAPEELEQRNQEIARDQDVVLYCT